MTQTLPPVPPSPSGEPDPGDPYAVGAGAPSFGDRISDNKGFRLAVLLGALGFLAYRSIWGFVIVLALVVSIFLHEMGHFLMAKRNGMKVTEFFIGFGPRIWSFRRGETEYGVKLVWLGAYVKIIGMSNLEEVPSEEEPRSYRAQPFAKRLPVILAGPVMNLALGLLVLFVVFAGFGKPSETEWQVRSVTSGSAAAAAGLQAGDRILSIDDQPIEDFTVLSSLVRARAGTTVEITVLRDGQESTVPATLGWSLTGSSAAQLGLRSGDRVTAVNGTPIATYPDLVGAMGNADGSTTLTYAGEAGVATIDVSGPVALGVDDYKGFLGVGQEALIERTSIIGAAGDSVAQFGTIVNQSVQGIGRVFSPSGIGNLFTQVRTANDDKSAPAVGQPSANASGSSSSGGSSSSSAENADRPSSILGIVNVGAQFGDQFGWAAVLVLLAAVNIFLGLINLVPLLPLDGGHVAVACYEGIRSRFARRPYRVNMAKLLPLTYVVVLVLMGLFFSTLYLDVVDPISIK